VEPEFAVAVDRSLGDAAVLVEPTSVVAKAWEQTEILGKRTPRPARTVLVTGAGPIGLLAALLGQQRGLEVHVFDQVDGGIKPELVKQLGATYHSGSLETLRLRPDIVIECTGYGPLVFELPGVVAPDGIICLTGISSGSHSLVQDPSAINKELVLENTVMFGSVNASRENYRQAVSALAKADGTWLTKLISRKVPLSMALGALTRQDGDVKVVVDLTC
jgi:threonine dehydrogenase-like Zn-dependent dehydrogenase